ncbi:MAG: hypothetical protein U0572_17790 [Phycisphaerales bacterium]
MTRGLFAQDKIAPSARSLIKGLGARALVDILRTFLAKDSAVNRGERFDWIQSKRNGSVDRQRPRKRVKKRRHTAPPIQIDVQVRVSDQSDVGVREQV